MVMVGTMFWVTPFQITKNGLKLGQILLTNRSSWVIEVYVLPIENLFSQLMDKVPDLIRGIGNGGMEEYLRQLQPGFLQGFLAPV
jgi:hypothetical protein